MEVAGDVPEIGTDARPRLPLVENQAAAGATVVAAAHLDRARLHDGTLRGEASSWPRPWARQRRAAVVVIVIVVDALGKLEGRVSHRAVGDGNCHLGRRQLIYRRLHQIRQRQIRQILGAAGLQKDHQRLLSLGTAGCSILNKKTKFFFNIIPWGLQ